MVSGAGSGHGSGKTMVVWACGPRKKMKSLSGIQVAAIQNVVCISHQILGFYVFAFGQELIFSISLRHPRLRRARGSVVCS